MDEAAKIETFSGYFMNKMLIYRINFRNLVVIYYDKKFRNLTQRSNFKVGFFGQKKGTVYSRPQSHGLIRQSTGGDIFISSE